MKSTFWMQPTGKCSPRKSKSIQAICRWGTKGIPLPQQANTGAGHPIPKSSSFGLKAGGSLLKKNTVIVVSCLSLLCERVCFLVLYKEPGFFGGWGGEEEVRLSSRSLTAPSTPWPSLAWTSGFLISREVGNEKYSTKITPNFGY